MQPFVSANSLFKTCESGDGLQYGYRWIRLSRYMMMPRCLSVAKVLGL